MLDSDNVTTAAHGIAHNKKKQAKNIISFSAPVRSWIYNRDEVFTVILTQKRIDKTPKHIEIYYKSNRGEKNMFEKVIVSEVNHGKATVHTYRNIPKIYTEGENIFISDGVYTWRFRIDSIVSIVII